MILSLGIGKFVKDHCYGNKYEGLKDGFTLQSKPAWTPELGNPIEWE
jgi:hypothetical protein